MTITDLQEYDPSLIRSESVEHNPYAVNPEALGGQIADLVANQEPYLDWHTNPDLTENPNGRKFLVYSIPSDSKYADIARSLEGFVIREDWGQDPAETLLEETPHDPNSHFCLVVDVAPEVPRIAATLRIADMLEGPSEAVGFYKREFGEDVELPEGLKVSSTDIKHGLWDIVGVFAHSDYRDGRATAWAYFGTMRRARDLNIGRFIANITDRELRNLHSLGIPFHEIEGSSPGYYEPEDGSKGTKFIFCETAVRDIDLGLRTKIDELLRRKPDESLVGISRYLAELANVVLSGTVKIDHITPVVV